MTDALPADIRVEQTAHRVRYVLPRRRGEIVRLADFLAILFGGLFTLLLLGSLASLIWGFIGQHQMPQISDIVILLVLLTVGLAVTCIGLVRIMGRSIIEVRDDRFRAGEGIGPFVLWRNRPLASIRWFRVCALKIGNNPLLRLHEGLAEIEAEFVGHESVTFARGYPRRWLTPLAEAIAEHIESSRTDARSELDETSVEVFDQVDDKFDTEVLERRRSSSPVERPSDTRVRVTEMPDGISIVIPPEGIRRSSGCLLIFALASCAPLTALGALTIIVPLLTGQFISSTNFGMVFLMLIFWVNGLAIALIEINKGRRHAILDVVDETLLVNRRNIFGLKQHEWHRDGILQIKSGPSIWSGKESGRFNLQFHLSNGETIGLFGGRDPDELDWIAWMLEELLGLNDETPDEIETTTTA